MKTALALILAPLAMLADIYTWEEVPPSTPVNPVCLTNVVSGGGGGVTSAELGATSHVDRVYADAVADSARIDGTYPLVTKSGTSITLDNHRRNLIDLSGQTSLWTTVREPSKVTNAVVRIRNVSWSDSTVTCDIMQTRDASQQPYVIDDVPWHTVTTSSTIPLIKNGLETSGYQVTPVSGKDPDFWSVQCAGANYSFAQIERPFASVSIPDADDFDAIVILKVKDTPTISFVTNTTTRIFLQPKGGKFFAPIEANKDYLYSFTRAHGSVYFVSRTEMEPAGE